MLLAIALAAALPPCGCGDRAGSAGESGTPVAQPPASQSPAKFSAAMQKACDEAGYKAP